MQKNNYIHQNPVLAGWVTGRKITGKEKAAFFTMLDALVAKKKLKDNLSNVLQLAQ